MSDKDLKKSQTPESSDKKPKNPKLEELRNELSNIAVYEKTAEEKDDKRLENTLSLIKFMLQKKDRTQEEIDFARKFISEIHFIRDCTKAWIWNLKEERVLIWEIQELLGDLKTQVESCWKEPDKFANLFEWPEKSPAWDEIKKIISDKIESEMQSLSLTWSELSNVKAAILSKLLNDKLVSWFVQWFSAWIEKRIDLFKGGDFKWAFEWLWEKWSWLAEIKKFFTSEWKLSNALKNLIEEDFIMPATKNIKELLSKKPELKDLFLKNPKAIAAYDGNIQTAEELIAKYPLSDDSEFYADTKKKLETVTAMISKFQASQKTKEAFIDGLSMFETWLWSITKIFWKDFSAEKFLEKLFSIKIIWSLLAMFFWYDSAESAVEWISLELSWRTSINNLKRYWNYFDSKKKTLVRWKLADDNKRKIDLIKDTDLSGLDPKRLSDFFKECKKAWVDIRKDNFWENVFLWEVKTWEKADWDAYKLPKIEADDLSDWFKWFYEKLNWVSFKKDEKKPEAATPMATPAETTPEKKDWKDWEPKADEPKPTKPAAAPVAVAAAAPKAGPVKEAPKTPEKKETLPSLSFDSIRQVAKINWKEYKTTFRKYWISFDVTSIWLNQDWTLTIAKGTDKVIIPAADTKNLYAALQKDWKYSWKNGDWKITFSIEA